MWHDSCIFGIGYGLGYNFEYNITKAVELCSEMQDDYPELCFKGLFSKFDTEFLNEEECREVPKKFREYCLERIDD